MSDVKKLMAKLSVWWVPLVAVHGAAITLSCGSEDSRTERAAVAAPDVAQQLKAALSEVPGAQVLQQDGVLHAFGTTMATGDSPAAAAANFIASHAVSLGVSALDLQPVQLVAGNRVVTSSPQPLGLMRDAAGQYRFLLYRYAHVRAGVPVLDSELLVLVKNSANSPVVWSSSTLKSLASFAPNPTLNAASPSAAKTLTGLQSLTDFTGRPLPASSSVSSLSRPELVVFAGKGASAAAARMAIRYEAVTDAPIGKWRVVADASSGDVLDIESLLVFDDVTGTVTGNVTSGPKAMDCDEEVSAPLPNARITGGLTTVTTDASGAFVLPNPNVTPLTLSSPLTGTYFVVDNIQGAEETLSQSVTPPGPAHFLHNLGNPNDPLRAQSNGYANAEEVRSFLLGYIPNYPTISTQLEFPVRVNQATSPCPGNAWYDYSSINFCLGNTTYSNTSFASVSQHEYGHHIVTSGGSGQGAYGEGMGDVVSALLNKDPGLGYGFYLNQCTSPLRTADNDCQYSATSCSSCGSEVHACGNLISGTIWSIREAWALSEPASFESALNELVLSSIPLHTGTVINSAIAVTLLTLDDDDGNLDNGAPHYDEICAGFSAHGMSCPPILTGLSVSPTTVGTSEGPNGGPFAPASFVYDVTNLGPNAVLNYNVSSPSAPAWLQIVGGVGQVALGQHASVTVQIDQSAAAQLPNGTQSATLQFTNSDDGVGNTVREVKLKVGIPTPVLSADFEDGVEGFTFSAGSANLWHRSTGCASTQAGHTTPASLYFGADSSCTFESGSVSGTATSPNVVIEDTSLGLLRLKYFLATEGGTTYDRASVLISVNGGVFTTVASSFGTGATLQQGTGVWQSVEVDFTTLIQSLPSANVQVQFAFNSVDGVYNSYAGFLVDDVEIRAFDGVCTSDADCDDGASCSGSETCQNGACVPGTPVSCDDTVACTVDSCSEQTSCVNQPSDASCSDNNACTGVESCDLLNGCLAGTPLTCNDSNLCTTDGCNPASGCTATPITCNDSNLCTTDGCNPASGCTATPITCNDSNACTTDSCNPATGCATTPIACNDSNACTVDSCNSATGCAYTPISCDDANPCTTDACGGGTCTHTDNGSCGTGPFQESGGTVVIEAEHPHLNTPRSNHTWTQIANASASGGQVMRVDPNNNSNINANYVGTSPELRYDVTFQTTGTYYVWLRGSGATADDDSCHVGIDNTGPASADRISTFTSSLGWSRATVDGPVATINVASTGLHRISLYMREDGFTADKLILTTNNNFTPTGAGPAESPRTTPPPQCSSNAQCSDGNPCTNDVCTSGVCSNPAANDGGACGDDGNVCTNDVCGSGVCTHPNNTASCADDGSACTNDICSAGMCTHPNNGSCGTPGPCTGLCTNPVRFTSTNYQSGNLSTAATCHETTVNLAGGVCGNFAAGRTLTVNGQTMTCNSGNWSTLPAKVNGGYCIRTTAGNQAWAYFATW